MSPDPDAGSVISHTLYMMVWAEIARPFGLMDSTPLSGNDSQAVGMRAGMADPIRKSLKVIVMVVGVGCCLSDVLTSVSLTSPVCLRSETTRVRNKGG